jgi:hypothetical protein
LEWLDLTLTDGRNLADVSDDFGPGDEFAGLRFASMSEVTTLFQNLGLTLGFIPTDPAVATATSFLGDTYEGIVGRFGFAGLFYTPPDSSTIGQGSAFDRTLAFDSPGTSLIQIQLTPGSQPDDGANGVLGVYLVRETGATAVAPEPLSLLVWSLLWVAGVVITGRRLRPPHASARAG